MTQEIIVSFSTLPEFSTTNHTQVIHLLSPATIEFPLTPEAYTSGPVPSLVDWQHLWSAWDIVTKSMVPREELLNKPIKLRNDLIFYLGHIPTFAGNLYGTIWAKAKLMWCQIFISQKQLVARPPSRRTFGQYLSVALILVSYRPLNPLNLLIVFRCGRSYTLP